MIVLDIAGNELRRLFGAPLAWVILAVVQFLLAIFFFVMLSQFMQPALPGGPGLSATVVAGIMQIAGIVLLLVAPFLTMRLFSDEQRAGTMPLLLSSPVTLTELVLGKYLGILGFLGCMLVMILLMPASLLFGTHLDLGQFGAGVLAMALLMASFAAIGLFMSTLTRQPAVAAISTFGVVFVLWIIHIAGSTGAERAAPVFAYLSLLKHYNSLLDGAFSSVDVIYYVILIVTFLMLSVWRLDAMRGHH